VYIFIIKMFHQEASVETIKFNNLKFSVNYLQTFLISCSLKKILNLFMCKLINNKKL